MRFKRSFLDPNDEDKSLLFTVNSPRGRAAESLPLGAARAYNWGDEKCTLCSRLNELFHLEVFEFPARVTLRPRPRIFLPIFRYTELEVLLKSARAGEHGWKIERVEI